MIDADKKKLRGVLSEVSNAMTRSEGERDFIREAIKKASDDLQLEKKILRKMARVYHRQNFADVKASEEEFLKLYEETTK
jgi:hypothetical protein